MSTDDILNIIARFLPGGDALPDSLRHSLVRSGKRETRKQLPNLLSAGADVVPGMPLLLQLIKRAESVPSSREASFSEVSEKRGLPTAVSRAVYETANDINRRLGELHLLSGTNEPFDMTKKQKASSASTTQSPAAMESRKRSSVQAVVKQFLDSGGKGVIRVSGSGADSDFSYDPVQLPKTSSSVPWTAPSVPQHLTKEAATVAAAQAKAAGDVRSRVMSSVLQSGMDPDKLIKDYPLLRSYFGIEG